jgi:hypothetical protein
MWFRHIRLVRMVVALCVALSLAFMPVLSQQAMAAHHTRAAADVAVSMIHSHEATTAKPCEKTQDFNADKDVMNCCDMSCSFVATLEIGTVPVFTGHRSGYHQVDADELQSRMTFGLKRPPRD